MADENLINRLKSIWKVIVVGSKPGNDVAVGVIPSLLDCGRLAGIGAMPPVAQQVAVALQYLLHALAGRCIHHGNLNCGTLRPNALQREGQKIGVMKNGNRKAEDYGITAQQKSVVINKIPISHRQPVPQPRLRFPSKRLQP